MFVCNKSYVIDPFTQSWMPQFINKLWMYGMLLLPLGLANICLFWIDSVSAVGDFPPPPPGSAPPGHGYGQTPYGTAAPAGIDQRYGGSPAGYQATDVDQKQSESVVMGFYIGVSTLCVYGWLYHKRDVCSLDDKTLDHV